MVNAVSGQGPRKIPSLVAALRPRQWIKNVLVFAAPLFAFTTDSGALLRVLIAFLSFSAISSAVYLFNDWVDLESDRLHPVKKDRPLASGRISAGAAVLTAVLLALGALGLAARVSKALLVVLGAYIVIQVAYNLFLKDLLILDIMTLASGFVLRAVAGGVAASVVLSPWFLFCVALLAFYVGLQKRKSELVRMSYTGVTTRPILREYSLPYLERVETALLASILMAYALWTIQGAPSSWMMLTVPFVLYGLLRYQYLSGEEIAERPEEVVFRDRALFINLALWSLTCLCILALLHRQHPV